MSNYAIPVSIDYTTTRPLASTVEQLVLAHPAESSTAVPGGTSTIYISNTQLAHLHGGETFLQFSITPTAAGTGIVVRPDGSALAFIQRIRVSQAGRTLIANDYANRTFSALRDFQSSPASMTDSICVGTDPADSADGVPMVTAKATSFAICLPVGIIGSMGSTSFPVHWCHAAELRVDITWAPVTEALCSTSSTTGASITNYSVSDIHLNAKYSVVSQEMDNMLKSAAMARNGDSVVYVHSNHLTTEEKSYAANATLSAERYGFNFSSLKAIYAWFTATPIASGGISGENFQRACTTRSLPGFKRAYLSVNGRRYPQAEVVGEATADDLYSFKPGPVFGSTKRALNTLGESGSMGNVSLSEYVSQAVAGNTAGTRVAASLFGIDTDRGSNMVNDASNMGINTSNSTVIFTYQGSAIATAHSLYVAALHDILHVINFETGSVDLVV